MIIEKFEEQVRQYYDRPAIKKGKTELTYGQLNEYADRVARIIIAGDTPGVADDDQRQAALLFEHGVNMIAAAIGALKACKTYVPLDISYPVKRLLYILENSGARLILTDSRDLALARELAGQAGLGGQEIRVINIEGIGAEIPAAPIGREASEDRLAYILYTSGSTGKPKGVYQTHRNVLYYTRNWIQRFSITSADRMSLFTSFTHDGCVQDIFSALLSGACLYPYSLKEGGSIEGLYLLLVKEKITLWHSVPSLYRFFANALTEKDQFYDLRWVLLGGEPLREHDLQMYRAYFPHARMANVYGQTESSVSAICSMGPEKIFDDMHLGEPLDETKILLVDEDGDIVETMGVGEIVVSGAYLAPGYWRDPESSNMVFTPDEELGRLYWTGDQGRLTAEGDIKILGRKDFQVKVRGFRVETGEIETALLQHRAVKEVVAAAKPDGVGDHYLCAYIVSNETLSPEELRKYLAAELPDYMIPRYFIFLEKMPLNPTGKIDRQRLPDPEEAAAPESVYAAPTDEIEEKLVVIWQEVIGIEKVGINDNFIQLGGHSLLVIPIISKIHQEFNVELQLMDVFSKPTIRELARLIRDSNPSLFSPIEPAEEKEYYELSHAQKRIYTAIQLELGGTSYNMASILQLTGELDRERLQDTFQKLIERHEILRTSFDIIGNVPVQRVHDKVEFSTEYCGWGEGPVALRKYIRAFDITQAPLIRVCLMKIGERKHAMMLDISHIVTDGISSWILEKDFMALYNRQELPPLDIQYKDFSEWENRLFSTGKIKKQEDFWIAAFRGELPVLELPTDFPRPDVRSVEAGDIIIAVVEETSKWKIYDIIKETDSTLFIFLLAVYNVLLNKYTGQEDIVVGTVVTGRTHEDLENVMGVFINMLPLRNRPRPGNRFKNFLEEVKQNSLHALENQNYPVEELVKKLEIRNKPGRHPLFDTELAVYNREGEGLEIPGLRMERYSGGINFAKFDLHFLASERNNVIYINLRYPTELFKRTTAQKIMDHFVEITGQVIENPGIKLEDIEITMDLTPMKSSSLEKEQGDFNF